MGYTKLKIYQAGLPDWVGRGYPVERGAPAVPTVNRRPLSAAPGRATEAAPR